jgi:hypothetical protein
LIRAVTAIYKGTQKGGAATLLRSYDSRKEPAPETNCTIWQAGRATCAIAIAFKPIQIGTSVFVDEGAGKYNPAPQLLDEAVLNEWPGREIGVFISIGTGKRPTATGQNQHEWWEGFLGGDLGKFAEARRRLIAKIEACEDVHQHMRNEYVAKRGVNPDNYYRLNVEVGVGEFGMNEWNQLAGIGTSTRRYLNKPEVRQINEDAARKMGRIEIAKRRHMSYTTAGELDGYERPRPPNLPPPLDPLAVELPGDEGPAHYYPSRFGNQHGAPAPHYSQRPSVGDKFMVIASDNGPQQPRRSGEQYAPGNNPRSSESSILPSPRRSHETQARPEPPPIPPKTPASHYVGGDPGWNNMSPRSNGNHVLPYPDTDGPPPIVNMARKPEHISR